MRAARSEPVGSFQNASERNHIDGPSLERSMPQDFSKMALRKTASARRPQDLRHRISPSSVRFLFYMKAAIVYENNRVTFYAVPRPPRNELVTPNLRRFSALLEPANSSSGGPRNGGLLRYLDSGGPELPGIFRNASDARPLRR